MSFNDIQNNVIYNENASYKVTAYGDVVFGDDESDRHSLSSGLIEMGVDGRPSEPVLVLSSRGGNKIGAIQNVRSINITHPLSDVAELSFDVYKEIDGVTYKDWDKIKDFKFIQMPHDNNWFEAKVTLDEENEIIKHVTCVHANEAELGQLNLYEVEINTDADIERDDYEETFFYNEDNPKASLLHRVLSDKAPHYQIYHVDDTLKGLWRQFSFNGTSIQDALNQIAEEVGCLFVYGEWSENDGKYHCTISAYDLEDYCYHCGKRGNYSEHVCTNCGSTNINYGYGEDTGIFISRENLATSINYESNTDNVKNCFRLVAGDDVMTAAIKSCNPSMSQYIWYFSDDMLEDMSAGLRNKVVEYQNLVSDYQTTQSMNVSGYYINNYNSLVTKYSDYNDELTTIDYPIIGTTKLTETYYDGVNLYGFIKSELMPASEKVESTTAFDQLEILQTGSNMSEVGISSVSGTIPYTTANSAIQSYAKVYIDTSRYKVTVFTYDIVGTAWSGEITIQSYTDDEDSATAEFEITLFDSSSNEKYAKWLNQSVQKTMANREVTDLSVVKLFNTDETLQAFKTRIQGYSLDYLSIMDSMATSAITILTEQGIANEGSTNTDIYTQLYKPYLDKSRAIQAEIAVKEKELSYLQRPTDDEGNTDPRYPDLGLLDAIVNAQNGLSKLLDMQTYLGDELWTELSFYRREDEYQNSNYISDGLTDGEIIEHAQRFVESANKEIIKASTLQHTISAPLIDFLIMPEFIKLQKKFKTGNWIRLKVDENVYKLRLTNWTVDFDNIEDLDVEFSDVIRVGGSISDIASILSKSRSMATTYDYTAKQAIKGKDASNTIKIYRDYGIDFRKIKAITSKGNTNIVYDDDGILLKRVDGTETLPEQARIYNNGIYITRDAWETVSTGLGHYSYVDPETGETVQTYGIIADTVIGRLILGENLKIYSQSGKFEIGDDGLKITSIDGEDNTDLFVVQKEKEDEQGRKYVEKYIYVDSDGEVKIAGNSVILGGKPLVEYIEDIIVGKNLIPLSKNLKSFTPENLTRSIVTYTDDSCTITNTYGDVRYGIYYDIDVESGLTYTLSFQASNVSGTNINYGVGNRTPDQIASWNTITGGYRDVVNGSNVCTFTIPDTVTKIRIYFGAGSLNGTMTISNLKLETGGKVTEWTSAPEDIQYAMKVATNYLSMDSSGVMVANMTDDDNNEYTPSNIETGKRNILITADDLRIRDGQNDLAIYGNTITLGKSNGKNVKIDTNGITLNDGSSSLASYGDSVVIGRTTNPHIVLDSNSFNAYSANNKSYFSLGDGSTSSTESYAVPDNLASFTTTYPINTITSVKVGSTTISSSRYRFSSGDNKLFLLDVPIKNSTVSVTYTYSSDDETASSNTQSFTVGAISLTIPLTVSNISIVSVIVRSGTTSENVTSDCDYNSSSNSIVFTNDTYIPPADSVVDVNYTINNTSPYFTFGTRNSSYVKGNGSASFASSGVASGANSFTTGISNKSTGTASFTTGTGNTASGIYSFAEGRNNTASGSYAHAEGYGNTVNNIYGHAEGYRNTVSGTSSHAEGGNNKSSGTYSHSEGYTNTASGAYSHAGGTSSIASGVTSFAHGEGLQASMKNAAAFGRYNEPLGFLFTVGNGTSSSARANAFAVGQGGNCYIGKKLISGTLSNNRKMFRTKEWSWDNLSIAANSTLGTHTSSIAIDYYTPIAISFIQLMNATTDGANSPNCNCYVCRFADTNRNMLSFNIKNLGDSAAKIRVRVEILYMATAALG